MEEFYYILSLKWSGKKDSSLVWWRPNDSGYTSLIGDAGLYDAERVKANQEYYNNGKDTIAVPEYLIHKYSTLVVPSEYKDQIIGAIKADKEDQSQ